jgi:hypothetical protein
MNFISRNVRCQCQGIEAWYDFKINQKERIVIYMALTVELFQKDTFETWGIYMTPLEKSLIFRNED